MKMLMLHNMRASPDGFRSCYYKAGYEYEISNMLARSFYADNRAVPVDALFSHRKKPPSRSSSQS